MKELLTLTVPGGDTIRPVAGMPDGGQSVLNTTLPNIVNLIFVIATLLAFFFIIWGGISWISSGGDKTKVDGARNKIVYAMIGLIVTFLSYFIINLVGGFFGMKILGPNKVQYEECKDTAPRCDNGFICDDVKNKCIPN